MARPYLTQPELDRIAELTEAGGLSNRAIAKIIGCSEGSVGWAQLRIGADKNPDGKLPPIPTKPVESRRGTHVVRRFTTADDALLLRLEAEGLTYGAIGRRLSPQRRPNSIQGRLMTLSRRAARAERRGEL